MSTSKMTRIDNFIDQFESAHKQNLCHVHYHTKGVLVVDIHTTRGNVLPALLLHVKNNYPEIIRVNTYNFVDFVRIGFWYDNY